MAGFFVKLRGRAFSSVALDFFVVPRRTMKDLHYTFTCTAAPVQADGTIRGKAFHFRSRHERWTFSVSEDPNVNPVDIQLPDQGEAHGFFFEERYGDKSHDASYMPLEEASQIIERCAEMYGRSKSESEI